MCSPDYFEVSYDINPWMTDQIGKVNKDQAQAQWHNLYNSLKEYADIDLIDAQPNLPDMVFTANAGIVIDDRVVLSKFAKNPRQEEEIHFARWFYDQGYIVHQPEQNYEGEGDHLIDSNNRHWMGYGFRTENLVANSIEKYLNVSVIPISLIDNRWYHLDTAFCPLPGNDLLWYSPAFSVKSQKIIIESFPKQINISKEDALKFACNCVCIGKDLFLPANTRVANILRDLNYRVHEFDLSEFIKAGGAAKCLTLLLDH